MWDRRGGPGKGSAGLVLNLVEVLVLRLEAAWAPEQMCSGPSGTMCGTVPGQVAGALEVLAAGAKHRRG